MPIPTERLAFREMREGPGKRAHELLSARSFFVPSAETTGPQGRVRAPGERMPSTPTPRTGRVLADGPGRLAAAFPQ